MASATSRVLAVREARVAREWRAARRRRPVLVRPARRGVSRATAADDDAACSLSADASSFRFEGTRRLYGDARFDALTDAHVVVLGMGGVGSWAVEALARSGVGALTLVDLDFVCVTNVNRQVLAADSSVGDAKAEVMRARVLDINPECDVRVVNDFVTERNVEAVLGIVTPGSPGKSVDYVLDAIDGENDKAAVVACCVHHHIPVLVTGGAGGIDHLGDIVLEDLANATFNRLLQRVRRLLRREYFFPRGGEGAFPGKKRNKKDGKFGVSAVYARENANYFRKSPGTKGRGGIGCDGVGGSAVFVTGALGFKAASHIVLRLMEAGDGADGGDEENRGKKTNKGRPAAAGWRSRVWPRGKAGGGDGGGGDGGGGGAGGGGGGGGDGESPGDGDDSRDGGDGGRDDGADEILSGASFATGAAFAATASLDDEATELSETPLTGEASTTSDDAQNDRNPRTARGELSRELSNAVPMKDIFDAHCHWHLDRRPDAGDNSARLAGALAGAAFTSTCPDDWSVAERFAEHSSNEGDGYYCVALGLHPWWAHRFPPPADGGGWPAELRERLISRPRAVVGEIGLDRVAVPLDEVTGERTGEPVDYANQLKCFTAQMDIASELRRPAVVHCVKAYGDAGDAFRARSTFPPKILMHSYGGTAAFLEGLVRMKKWGPRFYFGFSSVVNLRSPKTRDVIRSVPADRLVIESDLTSSRGAEEALRAMLAAVAECRGWTPEETTRVTRENALRFYLPEEEEETI
jgi:tRNA A37 threonylcarbamoyladenosine dehydratase/Tat protein secretion system quality control protein TatD with DNase activity